MQAPSRRSRAPAPRRACCSAARFRAGRERSTLPPRSTPRRPRHRSARGRAGRTPASKGDCVRRADEPLAGTAGDHEASPRRSAQRAPSGRSRTGGFPFAGRDGGRAAPAAAGARDAAEDRAGTPPARASPARRRRPRARPVVMPGLTGLPSVPRKRTPSAASGTTASRPPAMLPRGQASWYSTVFRPAGDPATATHGPGTLMQTSSPSHSFVAGRRPAPRARDMRQRRADEEQRASHGSLRNSAVDSAPASEQQRETDAGERDRDLGVLLRASRAASRAPRRRGSAAGRRRRRRTRRRSSPPPGAARAGSGGTRTRLREAAGERPLDDAVRRAEADRVDGDAAAFARLLGCLRRRQSPLRLGAVGDERARGGRRLGAVLRAAEPGAPRGATSAIASPSAVPSPPRSGPRACWTTWRSSVGGATTLARSAKATTPTRNVSGTRGQEAAARRPGRPRAGVGCTSVAVIERETSSASIDRRLLARHGHRGVRPRDPDEHGRDGEQQRRDGQVAKASRRPGDDVREERGRREARGLPTAPARRAAT